MKTLKFNKNSWHYVIAEHGADRHGGVRDDICGYIKDFCVGAISLVILGLFIASFGFIFWHIVFGIIFSIMLGAFVFTDFGIIGLASVGVLSSIFGTMYLVKRYKEYRRIKRYETSYEDGFFTAAYKSWREKYCVRIEFVEPENK